MMPLGLARRCSGMMLFLPDAEDNRRLYGRSHHYQPAASLMQPAQLDADYVYVRLLASRRDFGCDFSGIVAQDSAGHIAQRTFTRRPFQRSPNAADARIMSDERQLAVKPLQPMAPADTSRLLDFIWPHATRRQHRHIALSI